MSFQLDARLARDGMVIGKMLLSDVLLMRNAHFSWFVLVPRVEEVEFYLLPHDEQLKILEEINQLSRFVEANFSVDKMNIATIGNVVSQMHIHIVGRKKTDICWPNVVWGCQDFKVYEEAELRAIKLALATQLPAYQWQSM